MIDLQTNYTVELLPHEYAQWLRRRLCITQDAVSELTGYSKSAISTMERGGGGTRITNYVILKLEQLRNNTENHHAND